MRQPRNRLYLLRADEPAEQHRPVIVNRFLRALRAACGDCFGRGEVVAYGHVTRCSTCGGSGQA